MASGKKVSDNKNVLLHKIFEKAGLGGFLMASVVIVAIPSVATIKDPSSQESIFWLVSLFIIFFTGLYIFRNPGQKKVKGVSQLLEPAGISQIKWSVVFALISALLVPPLFGLLSLYFSISARKKITAFGNFFIIASIVAMILGAASGALINMQIQALLSRIPLGQ